MMFADLNPPYTTIVADPPWKYDNTRGTQTRAKRGRRAVTAADNYSTMTNQEIAALPVEEIAAEQAHLYLWVTSPRLYRGRGESIGPLEIMEAWGFTYVTLITWVKTGPPGMGFYFRGHTEHVLFGQRGKLRIPSEKREPNIVTSGRRGHSEKPAAFYDLVERVSPGPYVDLFNRQPRFGWDTWGFGYENVLSSVVSAGGTDDR